MFQILTNPRTMPTAMIILSAASSLAYLYSHNYKMAVYWACSAGLITSLTYL